MKNYRNLVAVGLVVLMFLSVYMMVSDATKKEIKLRQLSETAEQLVSEGLHEKAANTYSEAIEIKNDIQYYLRVVQFYYEAQKNQQSIAWAEHTKENFPKRPEGYEWLARLYTENGYVDRAYEVIDEFEGRKLQSKQMTQLISKLNTSYYTDYSSCTDVKEFSGGYIALCKKNVWGLGNAKGKLIVNPQYDYVGYCSNATIPVRDANGTWYFMNTEGELFANLSTNIEGTIQDIGLYNNELFPVKTDGQYSYYTIDFEKKLSGYEFAGAFSGGVAAVKKNGKWSLINPDGIEITQELFDEIVLDERGVCCLKNIIIAKKGDNYFLYDNLGRLRSENTFEGAKCAGGEGLVPVMIDGLWGFANGQGELLVEPKYYDAKPFSCDLAPVKDAYGWGYIDLNGNMVISGSFSECTCFSENGVAFAKSADEWSTLRLYRFNH